MKQTEMQYLAEIAYGSYKDLSSCIEDAIEQMIASRNWKTYLTTFDLFTVLHLKARMKTFNETASDWFENYEEDGHEWNDLSLEMTVRYYNKLLCQFRRDIVKLFDFCRKDVAHLSGNGEESFLALTYGGYIR